MSMFSYNSRRSRDYGVDDDVLAGISTRNRIIYEDDFEVGKHVPGGVIVRTIHMKARPNEGPPMPRTEFRAMTPPPPRQREVIVREIRPPTPETPPPRIVYRRLPTPPPPEPEVVVKYIRPPTPPTPPPQIIRRWLRSPPPREPEVIVQHVRPPIPTMPPRVIYKRLPTPPPHEPEMIIRHVRPYTPPTPPPQVVVRREPTPPSRPPEVFVRHIRPPTPPTPPPLIEEVRLPTTPPLPPPLYVQEVVFPPPQLPPPMVMYKMQAPAPGPRFVVRPKVQRPLAIMPAAVQQTQAQLMPANWHSMPNLNQPGYAWTSSAPSFRPVNAPASVITPSLFQRQRSFRGSVHGSVRSLWAN